MNQSIARDIAAVMPAVERSGLLVQLCTITEFPGAFTDSGAPDPSVPYTARAGMSNIPCIAPPISIGTNVQPTEMKELTEIYAKNVLHVLLGGFYPAIIAANRALIGDNDGAGNMVAPIVEYDIVGIESDSQGVMTRMAVQVVTI